ncbi:MAG: hypothetical protein ACETWM_07120 [Candidatus Lokiarchaeia archaeon]
MFHEKYYKGFLTTEEKIEKPKEYKEWLDSESKGVEESYSRIEECPLNLTNLFL